MSEKSPSEPNGTLDRLTEKQKFSEWQDIHNEQVWAVDYTPGDLPFSASFEGSLFGDVIVGHMFGTIKKANRTGKHIAADGCDAYMLLVNKADTQLSGIQCGRDYSIAKGQGALISTSESSCMSGADFNRWSNIAIPRALVQSEFGQVNDRLALCIDRDNEALRLLNRYCALLLEGPALTSQALGVHAGETIIDLVGLATGAKGERAEFAEIRGLRAARLEAILGEIASGFSEPGISASRVARKLGISERYVHDVLEQTGSTFSMRVTELRLVRARQMLVNPDNRGLQIGEIAFAAGFGDISYFNRLFRRRFGMSPRRAR